VATKRRRGKGYEFGIRRYSSTRGERREFALGTDG
jgi:hypothetical protein